MCAVQRVVSRRVCGVRVYGNMFGQRFQHAVDGSKADDVKEDDDLRGRQALDAASYVLGNAVEPLEPKAQLCPGPSADRAALPLSLSP